MTMHDDDGARTAPPALVRPKRSRLKTVAGVTGLAAVLGAGSYLTTSWVLADDETRTQEVTAISALATPGTGSSEPTVSVSATASPAATTGSRSSAPVNRPTRDEETVAEEIRKAREQAAKDGHPLRRALQAGPDVAEPVGEVEVTTEGHLGRTGKTLRLVSARYDLTGQRELLWIAGDRKKVGEAECTQTFKFSNEGAAAERPTMMSCWRTSPTRSVVAVAVVLKGRPDAEATVAELNKRWNTMD